MSEPARSPRAWLLAAPTWLAMGVFLILPLAIVLVQSFAQRAPMGGVKPVEDLGAYMRSMAWLENYRRSLDPLYLWIFWRSLWMAVVTTVLCLLVSYPAAYYIALLAPARRKAFLLGLVIVPFWTSFLIRTAAWRLILQEEGVINTALRSMGVIAPDDAGLPLLFNGFAVMIGLVYGELPFMVLPIYASLEKLDRTLLEAAGDLGARRRAAFWRVTWPLSLPGVAAGFLLVFVPSVGQFVVSQVLGGGKYDLMGNVIQRQFQSARDQPFGSALAVELTLGVTVVALLYGYYTRRRGESVL